MFALAPAPTFTCTALIPRLDAPQPVPLQCTCRHQTVRALLDLQRRLQADGLNDVDVLDSVLLEWDAVGPDGSPVPYSREELEKMLDNFPYAASIIFQAYKDALQQGRLGN